MPSQTAIRPVFDRDRLDLAGQARAPKPGMKFQVASKNHSEADESIREVWHIHTVE